MDFYYDKNKKVDGDMVSQEAFMDYKEDTYDVLGSVFIRNIDKLEQGAEGKITDENCRFDNLSYKWYSKVNYWWILMEFNAYIDWGIQEGDNFKVPKVQSISSLIHKLIVRKNSIKV